MEITTRKQNEIQNLYKCITQKAQPKAWYLTYEQMKVFE